MFIYDGKTYDKIWFTSDEHYGSERALILSKRLDYLDSVKYEKKLREYESYLKHTDLSETTQKAMIKMQKNSVYGICINGTTVDKMNTDIIDKSNSRVMDNDLVFHVGDFGDYRYAQYLNGSHILIMGNYEYDDCAENFDFDMAKFKKHIIDNYNFIDVIGKFQLNLNKIDGFDRIRKRVQLIDITHKPTDCTFNWATNECHQAPDGTFFMNLFGHVHEKFKIKKFGINVGIDCHHFYPMSQEEVEFYLWAILNAYDDDVFC